MKMGTRGPHFHLTPGWSSRAFRCARSWSIKPTMYTCVAWSLIHPQPSMTSRKRSGVTEHSLPPDSTSTSGGASVVRILSPPDIISPGDSVLGQNLLPQGESSPCTGTLALGYFLRRSACPRTFPPAELLS